ncbi:MAG: DUF4236 domain-containing protein [Deltaproteobacteria bacterium]|nr:DUF4236 domain-containing protein [Deltaproteobacteria bacterium]
MAIRFRRSVKIIPGVRLNFGKRGMSVSAGVRGATVTAGKRGVYGNVGIPGTGLSFREKIDGKSRSASPKKVSTTRDFQGKVELILVKDGSVEIQDESGNTLPKKYIKIGREQNRNAFDSWLTNKCNEINSALDKALNIHINTPSPDAKVEFIPAPYEVQEPIKPQPQKVGLMGKLFASQKAKIDKENQEAMEKYKTTYSQWEINKNEHEENQRRKKLVIEKGRFKDPDSMADYLEYVISTIDWPRETLVSLDVQDVGKRIMIDVDLPEIEDMPKKYASVAKNGLKLNIKSLSDTQTRKDYMTHIHGIGFRIIGETFTHLPKAEQVILSGFSQRLNPATGIVSDEYLYSFRTDRSQWCKINFSNLNQVDVVESLGNFELKRKMTKTGIFKPIEPFDS